MSFPAAVPPPQVVIIDLSAGAGNQMTMTFRPPSGRTLKFTVTPFTTISEIQAALEVEEQIAPTCQRWLFNGARMEVETRTTLEAAGIQDGDQIELFKALTGAKPVIYLFPPAGVEVDATVKLSLVPEWKVSVLYPVVPTTLGSNGSQALEWNVKATSDGTLLEKNTGLEVSYLFWEAEALKGYQEPLSPSPSPTIEQGSFDFEPAFIPNQPCIDATNSVVLEVSKLTIYLDKTLKCLGLHTEARTSFITYWLPSFLKHRHVALRFLPQVAYEKAAPMAVTPAPDVTVRLFMLFKGLKVDELQHWSEVAGVAEDDPSRWRQAVGVDDRSLSDPTLFRVVEWGGMEVA